MTATPKLPRYMHKARLAGGRVGWRWTPHSRYRHLISPERLPDDPPAAAARAHQLNAQLDAARAGLAGGDPAAPAPGSLAWLIVLYRASPDWRRLAPSTRTHYARHLDALAAALGTTPLAGWTPKAAAAWVDGLTDDSGRLTRQAHYRVQVLRAVFGWARRRRHVAAQPFDGLRLAHVPRRAPAIWTFAEEDDVLAALAAPATRHLRRAVALGLYTGARVEDILRLGDAHLRADTDSPTGWAIELTQGKTRRPVWIPLHPRAAAELGALPTGEAGTWCRGPRGGRLTSKSLGKALRPHLRALGLELTPQGWRASAVTRLAEAGCTTPMIGSITGHSLVEIEAILDRYHRRTRVQANAAMAAYAQLRPAADHGTTQPADAGSVQSDRPTEGAA